MYVIEIESKAYAIDHSVIAEWCRENTPSIEYFERGTLWFPRIQWTIMKDKTIMRIEFGNLEDAVAFKMRWS